MNFCGVKMGRRNINRFPRLELDHKTKIVERILRITYNKMRKSKDTHFQAFNWDIYKTKQGWRAKLAFIFLAEKLIRKNIDPALYIKVMSRYGQYKTMKILPHPTWLRKSKTIEKFMWVYRKERKSYDLHLDWKKELNGWSDLDIYSAIRDSGGLVQQAMQGMKIGKDEAMMMLYKDLSPWYIAIHSLQSRDLRRCLKLINARQHVRHIAEKALKRSFQQNSVSY